MPTRRILFTAVMFALAIVCVGVASVTHSVIPLFVAWVPLLAVPWMLTRREPGEPGRTRGPPGGTDPSDGGSPDGSTP